MAKFMDVHSGFYGVTAAAARRGARPRPGDRSRGGRPLRARLARPRCWARSSAWPPGPRRKRSCGSTSGPVILRPRSTSCNPRWRDMTAMPCTGTIRAGHRSRPLLSLAAVVGILAASTGTASAAPVKSLLVTGLASGAGSTIGPDGMLYVTVGANRPGRSDRSEHRGEDDIPQRAAAVDRGLGGAFDVEFIDGIAYVLVTVVGTDIGGHDVVGIYRRDGPSSFTVIADIGAFAAAHPPQTNFFIPHRRAVRDGAVPRGLPGHGRAPQPGLPGLARRPRLRAPCVRRHRPDRPGDPGNTIYMAEAGPTPICHRPAGSSRSARRIQRPSWWPPAPGSSSTWSSPATASMASHRAIFPVGNGRWLPGVAEHRRPHAGRTRPTCSTPLRPVSTSRPLSSSSGPRHSS